MTNEDMVGPSSLAELMELARSRALLDDWDVQGDVVRLSIGTYELELRCEDADRFVRGLLRTHKETLNMSGD